MKLQLRPAGEFVGGVPANETGLFYGLHEYRYHAPSLGLSRSMAETLVFKSPAHMRYEVDHPEPATAAMQLGTLVHLACLEPEKLQESYWVRPECNPDGNHDDTWHGSKKWCKAWKAGHADRQIVTPDEIDSMWGCVLALQANATVRGMLTVGVPEVSAFVVHEGVHLRCRPDLLAEDDQGRIWILDIKKVQDATLNGFKRQVRGYHLDFQEAFYRFVLARLGIEVYKFLFVAVEEEPPHGVGLFENIPSLIDEQTKNVCLAIDTYRQCVEANRWPGYPQDIQQVAWRIYEP